MTFSSYLTNIYILHLDSYLIKFSCIIKKLDVSTHVYNVLLVSAKNHDIDFVKAIIMGYLHLLKIEVHNIYQLISILSWFNR